MKWLIAAGVGLVIAGCGSSSSPPKKSAQQQAANQLGAAASGASTSTTTAGALPNYSSTVQAMVETKVQKRIAQAAKNVPGAPSDAQVLGPSTTCTQSGGTENYSCSVGYTLIGQAEGFAEQYQASVAVTCYEAHNCSITSVGTPKAESGTQ